MGLVYVMGQTMVRQGRGPDTIAGKTSEIYCLSSSVFSRRFFAAIWGVGRNSVVLGCGWVCGYRCWVVLSAMGQHLLYLYL